MYPPSTSRTTSTHKYQDLQLQKYLPYLLHPRVATLLLCPTSILSTFTIRQCPLPLHPNHPPRDTSTIPRRSLPRRIVPNTPAKHPPASQSPIRPLPSLIPSLLHNQSTLFPPRTTILYPQSCHPPHPNFTQCSATPQSIYTACPCHKSPTCSLQVPALQRPPSELPLSLPSLVRSLTAHLISLQMLPSPLNVRTSFISFPWPRLIDAHLLTSSARSGYGIPLFLFPIIVFQPLRLSLSFHHFLVPLSQHRR